VCGAHLSAGRVYGADARSWRISIHFYFRNSACSGPATEVALAVAIIGYFSYSPAKLPAGAARRRIIVRQFYSIAMSART
jgi:hypothetical protein